MSYTTDNIYVNRTIFVDSKFGSDLCGKTETLNKPFKSIGKALYRLGKIRVDLRPWIIVIRPGIYFETINLPNFVSLIGEDRNNIPIISNIIIIKQGGNNISNLKILSDKLPLVDINFGDNINSPVNFTNVNFESIKPNNLQLIMALHQTKSITGVVNLTNCNFNIDLSNKINGTNILIKNSVELNLVLTNLTLIGSNQAQNTFITSEANTNIRGGQSNLQISTDQPIKKNELFITNQKLLMQNHNIFVVEKSTIQPTTESKIDYIIFKSLNSANIDVINTIIKFDISDLGFRKGLRLALADNEIGSKIKLFNIYNLDQFGNVPKIIGDISGVDYVGISNQANIVSNGGEYYNIRNISNKDLFIVEDNDRTLLISDGVFVVELPDPKIESVTTIYKGKIVTIKSITQKSFLVIGSNNSIFDNVPPINFGETVTFQNDGSLWYVISYLKPNQ